MKIKLGGFYTKLNSKCVKKYFENIFKILGIKYLKFSTLNSINLSFSLIIKKVSFVYISLTIFLVVGIFYIFFFVVRSEELSQIPNAF